MGSYGNPLVGSGWNQPQSDPSQVLGATNPISLPQNTAGTNFWGGSGATLGNPGNYGNPAGAKEISRNTGLNNVIAGQLKNIMAPQFASLMGGYGTQAAGDVGAATNFFKQLMNFGSPFYRQQQTASFNQGVQQNQNAAAQARQQLGTQGYGSTPSGANAAMIGGMAQQGSQNLAEQYLQNLFQNEQLQTMGAQGMDTSAGLMAQLAGLFNPTQLLGGTSVGADPYGPVTPNAFQNFNSIAQGVGALVSPFKFNTGGGQGGNQGGSQ